LEVRVSSQIFYVLGLIAIMVIAGILGSYCRRIFDKDNTETRSDGYTPTFWDIIIPCIVAAFVIPLFLSIGKSEVFTEVVKGEEYSENMFIVFAFCLLAAVSARSFVNALARQALQKAAAAEKKADEASELASEEPRTIKPADARSEVAQTKAVADTMADFEGSEQERLVLRSLIDSDYVRRSVTGIAKETGLDKREVRNILRNLVARGVVIESPSKRTGSLLYQAKLSPAG
jgi:hypothetical protein